jgi:hypothetical protein
MKKQGQTKHDTEEKAMVKNLCHLSTHELLSCHIMETGKTVLILLCFHLLAKIHLRATNVIFREITYVNKLSKKINVPFSEPCLSKIIRKNANITSRIFIVKGLNTVSHACSMNHKQLMNIHLWNSR